MDSDRSVAGPVMQGEVQMRAGEAGGRGFEQVDDRRPGLILIVSKTFDYEIKFEWRI